MTSKPYTLKPEYKNLLLCFIEDDDKLDVIESTVGLASRRGNRVVLSWFAISSVSLFATYASLFSITSSFLKYSLAITGICVYTVGSIWFNCMAYEWAVDSSFRAVLGAMQKVDAALQSAYASPPRAALASELLKCAKRIRFFGSRPGFRLHMQIIKQEARRASKVLRDLIYPAMLGNDKELEELRSVLGKAAVEIGTSNWVKVCDLAMETGQYQADQIHRRIFSSGRLTAILILALTAIPAIPILVSFFKIM